MEPKKETGISFREPITSVSLVNLTDSVSEINYVSFPCKPNFVYLFKHSLNYIYCFVHHNKHYVPNTVLQASYIILLKLRDRYKYYVHVGNRENTAKKVKVIVWKLLVNWAETWAQVWRPCPYSQAWGILILCASHSAKYLAGYRNEWKTVSALLWFIALTWWLWLLKSPKNKLKESSLTLSTFLTSLFHKRKRRSIEPDKLHFLMLTLCQMPVQSTMTSTFCT